MLEICPGSSYEVCFVSLEYLLSLPIQDCMLLFSFFGIFIMLCSIADASFTYILNICFLEYNELKGNRHDLNKYKNYTWFSFTIVAAIYTVDY